MPFVCIFGTRLFGACDYFTVEGREMYVRTKFYHFNFMPCGAEESLLFLPDGRAIKLPEVVGRSVGWAWLRYLAWVVFITFMGVAVVFLTTGLTAVWPWALVALSVVCLGVAIFVTVYKPKASEESKQEYLNMVGQMVARRYRRRQMAAAAAVHGGPAHEVVAIEQPPAYPGLHRNNVNATPTGVAEAGSSGSSAAGIPTAVPVTTGYPNTAVPTTGYAVPTTGYPNTAIPTTGHPNTAVPTTGYPTTAVPATGYPDTAVPATGYPNTAVPTTGYPNTAVPILITGYPNNAVPIMITHYPNTAVPTTGHPNNVV
ncbi:PREDICTED: RNA-binding protein 12-like [Branchiostoma belcheri]|uniref:RNA-binding protein 12-like n=1 Tax=Branchiostoma belcheri TaxID=7741 RepID=A0A6P4Z9S3_BRABE|nr:PREDICTED: RNA-binding protein 12-like [Branchiostoma belcheri]